jgi:apoptosis-stimulating of p53 protein 1
LLAAKEQRLRFLKAQEARGAAAAAEGERLRRLRERVEAQESKLRRLRALRGQVDLQKTYNVTLSKFIYLFKYLLVEIICKHSHSKHIYTSSSRFQLLSLMIFI